MNEEQYLQVCECCDELLRANDSTLMTVAIPWLHVLNEHPVILARYEPLFSTHKSNFRLAFRQALIFLWSMRGGEKTNPDWYSSVNLPKSVDVIFVSHLLNESQIGVSEDFYFGKLPEALRKKGVSTAVTLLDHTGLNLERSSADWPSDMVPRLFFRKKLGWLGELKLRNNLRKESRRLQNLSDSISPSLKKRVCQTAVVQTSAPSTIATLRLHYQVKEMIDRLRPDSIVVTYEGHAWERIIFAAARAVNPSIRCIGYHHAILFPHHYAIKRSLGRAYDPDMICVGGEITRKELMEAGELHDMPVVTVGTHRQSRSDIDIVQNKLSNLLRTCLVVPDGTIEECLTILKFVLDVAAVAPDIKFIIRMHPVMSFAAVAAKDARLLKLPENVQLSDQSIEHDFDRCRWAIYRGSGAAIRAVIAGLRPFYFKPPSEQLCIDPLYRLNAWRCVVSCPDELLVRVRLDVMCDPETLLVEFSKAQSFCEEYFTPVDLEKFSELIVSKGV